MPPQSQDYDPLAQSEGKDTAKIKATATQDQILEELRLLNRLQAAIATDPSPKTQAIWSFIFQTFGLIVGTLFGVFAVLAWRASTEANSIANEANDIAKNANDLSLAANKLALAGFCNGINGPACDSVQQAAISSINAYASLFYSITVTVTGTTSTASTRTATSSSQGTASLTSSASLPSTRPTSTNAAASATSLPAPGATARSANTGAIVGGVVGSVAGLIMISGAVLVWRRYRDSEERNRLIKDLSLQQSM